MIKLDPLQLIKADGQEKAVKLVGGPFNNYTIILFELGDTIEIHGLDEYGHSISTYKHKCVYSLLVWEYEHLETCTIKEEEW